MAHYFPHPQEIRIPPERHVLYDDRRASRERFHYLIRKPHWWRSYLTPPRFGAGAPVQPLCVFGPEDQPTTRLRAASWLFPIEIAAADWHYELVTSRGDEILEVREIVDPARGPMLDLLTRGPSPSGPVVTRSLAVKTGAPPEGRITLVEAYALETDYPSWAEDFAAAIGSFRLRRPLDFPYLERLRRCARARPGDFATYLPASWKAIDVQTSEEASGWHLSHFVLAPNDTPLARITLICSGAARSEAEVVEPFLRSLRAQGLQLDLSGPAELPSFGGLDEVRGLAGRGRAAGAAPVTLPDGRVVEPTMQVRVEVGRRGRHRYLLGLVGLHRDIEPRSACVATRAFELAKAHFRTV